MEKEGSIKGDFNNGCAMVLPDREHSRGKIADPNLVENSFWPFPMTILYHYHVPPLHIMV
jgi:hypothetical protein